MTKLDEMFQFLDSIKMGETVLVEYDSPDYTLDFLVLLLKRYATARDCPFIVDDHIDVLSIINKHLAFLGRTNVFDDTLVVKTGGVTNVGKVVERVKMESEPVIYLRRHEAASDRAFEKFERSVNAVIGFERLFAFVESYRNLYEVISSVEKFLGNPRRKAFYIIDRNITLALPINPLPELEKISSTFLKARLEGNRLILRIRKSPNINMTGWELVVPVEELLERD